MLGKLQTTSSAVDLGMMQKICNTITCAQMCCSNVKPGINNFQTYHPFCLKVSVIEDESGGDEDMGDVDGADGGEGGEDEEPDEYVHVNEKFYYLE